MFVLGLTGPTGAGKGVVAALLRENGVPVIDADQLSREVTAPGHPCLSALAAAFSPGVLQNDGSLNRAALAEAAFCSPEKTALLNSIVHPAVIALSNTRLTELKANGCAFAAIDAPLLFESGMDAACHRTLAVLASPEQRLTRIIARDGLSKEQALARMNAQPPDIYYEERADEVMRNDGDIDSFRAAVRRWVKEIV